jgi:MFS family permease
MLGMATGLYIMDVSSVERRTARLCFLDAAFSLGVMVGNPLGTWLKALLGYVGLVLLSLSAATLTLVYVFFLKDSIHLVSEERRIEILIEKKKADVTCDRGRGRCE